MPDLAASGVQSFRMACRPYFDIKPVMVPKNKNEKRVRFQKNGTRSESGSKAKSNKFDPKARPEARVSTPLEI